MTVGDLYNQVLNFEARRSLYRGTQENTVNVANKGGGRGSFPGRGGGAPRGGRAFPSRGTSNGARGRGRAQSGADRRPICQVCFKRGHTAVDCWYRYDKDYIPDSKNIAAVATSSYGVDTNWYINTRATDHITGELEKLTVNDKYNGGEQIHTASEAGSVHTHSPGPHHSGADTRQHQETHAGDRIILPGTARQEAQGEQRSSPSADLSSADPSSSLSGDNTGTGACTASPTQNKITKRHLEGEDIY
nr:uncharacterized protein LOC107280388 [Oryza sativa Japonica Group]